MEEKFFEGLKYLVSYPEGFQEDKKYPPGSVRHRPVSTWDAPAGHWIL